MAATQTEPELKGPPNQPPVATATCSGDYPDEFNAATITSSICSVGEWIVGVIGVESK